MTKRRESLHIDQHDDGSYTVHHHDREKGTSVRQSKLTSEQVRKFLNSQHRNDEGNKQ